MQLRGCGGDANGNASGRGGGGRKGGRGGGGGGGVGVGRDGGDTCCGDLHFSAETISGTSADSGRGLSETQVDADEKG